MNKKVFLKILNQYTKSETNLFESAYVDKWYESLDKTAYAHNDAENKIAEEVYAKIQAHIHQQKKKKAHIIKWTISVAASIVLILSVSVLLYFYINKKENNLQQPIASKTEKTILKLADGSTIELNKENADLANEGGAHITMEDSATIVYKAVNEKIPVKMNEVQTATGKNISLKLPDGTKVWLNAISSIKFPTRFEGAERKVSINGEAYFEVAKNKSMPFVVEVAGKQKITVLGTHFNVAAYPDDMTIKTTLLEGSVNVSTHQPGKTMILKPGEQSILYAQKIEKKEGVKLDEIMAWKENLFVFDQENIERIAKQLKRWYGNEVIIDASAKKLTFSGKIPRTEDVQTVLQLLEKTNTIRYTIIGNQIKIYHTK